MISHNSSVGLSGKAVDWCSILDSPMPFPTYVFAKPVESFVQRVAASITCPVDLPATAALATLATAIGTSRSIEIKKGFKEYPGFFAACVASPGTGKSAAIRLVTEPLRQRQITFLEEYHSEQLDRAEGCRPPAASPPPESVIVTDTTTEALAVDLQASPRGILLVQDELSGFIPSLLRYRKSGDLQFFLSAWSNETIKVSRRKRQNDPIFVANPFLSIIGGIQPSKLSSLSSDRDGEDGFLDRFFFACPKASQFTLWSHETIPDDLVAMWSGIVNQIFGLRSGTVGSAGFPDPIPMSPDAKSLFIRSAHGLESAINGQVLPQHLRSFVSKHNRHLARLALILRITRWAAVPEGKGSFVQVVEAQDVNAAIELYRYQLSHWHRVITAIKPTASWGGVDALLDWMQRKGLSTCTPRDVVRAGVGGTGTTSDAESLLRLAVANGYGCWDASSGKPCFMLAIKGSNETLFTQN